MPSCAAYGCSNTTGKAKNKKFFMIPKPKGQHERLQAARWLHNIGTGHTVKNFIFTKEKVVRQDHFHEDCFNQVKRRLMESVDSSKKYLELLPGAVPTIFTHHVYEEINMDGTSVLRRNSSVKRRTEHENQEVCGVCFHKYLCYKFFRTFSYHKLTH